MKRVVLLLGALLGMLGQTALAVPSIYDGFDYANDASPLEGKGGGYGWAGDWVETGAGAGNQFTLTQSETSLDLPNLPFEPIGDSVIATGPADGGSNNNRASRVVANPYDLATDNTFYASYLMTKTGSDTATSANNQEFNLRAGTASRVRLGSTSGNQFWLGTSSNTIEPVTFGDSYFLVLRVDSSAAGDDMLSLTVYDETESVPLGEPASYDATYSFSSSSVLDNVFLWIGTNATGGYDEVRLGETWEDVTSINPNFTIGDFDFVDGITTADYEILTSNLFSGSTYEQGDVNFDGQVDLADFAVFREIYVNAGFSLEGLAIPEPSALLLTFALAAAVGSRRQRG